MRRHLWLVLLIGMIVLGGLFVVGIGASLLAPSGSDPFTFFSRANVGLVSIEGEIFTSDDVVGELESFRKDDRIRAVIVRLNSPGGVVAASQEIAEAVSKLAAVKPVVISMGSIAASGAYQIAIAGTRILANPGTITGSIGVRMEHVNIGELLQFAKVKHETLKSGQYKDIGSFDRPISPEEREILEGLLQDIHEQFKADVAKARNLSAEEVESLADGRVFSGREALKKKLVDELGGFAEAIALAGKLGGIEGEPELVEQRRGAPRWMEYFFDAMFQSLARITSISSRDMLLPISLFKGGSLE